MEELVGQRLRSAAAGRQNINRLFVTCFLPCCSSCTISFRIEISFTRALLVGWPISCAISLRWRQQRVQWPLSECCRSSNSTKTSGKVNFVDHFLYHYTTASIRTRIYEPCKLLSLYVARFKTTQIWREVGLSLASLRIYGILRRDDFFCLSALFWISPGATGIDCPETCVFSPIFF